MEFDLKRKTYVDETGLSLKFLSPSKQTIILNQQKEMFNLNRHKDITLLKQLHLYKGRIFDSIEELNETLPENYMTSEGPKFLHIKCK